MANFLGRTRISGEGIVAQEEISAERIAAIVGDGVVRRVHFPTIHTNALRRDDSGKRVGRFAIPFRPTVAPLFEADTGLTIFNSEYGPWRAIDTEGEFAVIENWVRRQGTRVFIRNCLPLCVAIDFNMRSEGEYTDVGKLEDRAKSRRDQDAIELLTNLCCDTVRELPFYKDVSAVAAVPARPGKDYDLPTVIADEISGVLGIPDLTPNFNWFGDKGSLKKVPLEEKWERLDAADLRIEEMEIDRDAVLLVDDLYQSGTTMQYVAMKLLEAGADLVYGLALVKSWGDADNV